MENKKNFIKGVCVGIASIIILTLTIKSANLFFRRMILNDLSINQKIKEIKYYVDKYSVNEFDRKLAKEGLFMGMVDTLQDPYSYYMPKEIYKEFMQQTEGNYVGIGVIISKTEENNLKINKVFPNSPASDVGLEIGDIIKKVEGETLTEENFENITSKIKGEEGTKVNLTILDKDENKEKEISVLRKKLDVPTVEYEMLENNIGYIHISQFDRVTEKQFKDAFNEIEKKSNGLIIDLRNNPGGLLDVVCKITDLLVPEGTITYIEDKNGRKEYEYSDKNYYNKPLVILVNENSASASEVLAGAIKDYGVGELIGTKTFGKGIVQNIFTLSDGSGLKVTIAKYYTPNGICIQGTGIEPDYVVENQENTEIDFQLEKAIEVINKKIGN